MYLWGTLGEKGEQGDPGLDGADGDKGWSPALSVTTDGERRVLSVFNWVAGEGTEPSESGYIGAFGLEFLVGNGIDIRGPAGQDGYPYAFRASQAGCDPTGTVSSSAALNAMITTVTASGTRPAIIYLDPDENGNQTYKFDDFLIFYSKLTLLCRGATVDFSGMAPFSNAIYAAQTGDSDTIFNEDISIIGGTFIGPTNGTILPPAQMKRLYVAEAEFQEGLASYFYNTNIGIVIERCRFLNANGDDWCLGFTDKCKDITVRDNQFENGGPLFISSGAYTSGCQNFRITGNRLHNIFGTYAVNIYGADGVVFENNRVENDSGPQGTLLSADANAKNIKFEVNPTKNLIAPPINLSAVSCGPEFRGAWATEGNGTGAPTSSNGRLNYGRLKNTGGTSLTSSDMTLSASWGANANATKAISGTDSMGEIAITASGAGIAANPTVTIANKDGTWNSKAVGNVSFKNGGSVHVPCSIAVGDSSTVITCYFTPVAATTYRFYYEVKERQ